MKTHIIVRLVAAMCLAMVVLVPAITAKRLWVGFLYNGFPPFSYIVQETIDMKNEIKFKTFYSSKSASLYIFRLNIYCNCVTLYFFLFLAFSFNAWPSTVFLEEIFSSLSGTAIVAIITLLLDSQTKS